MSTAILSLYSKELFTLFGTIVAWGLNRYLRPKARLVQSVRHAANILIDEPSFDEDGKIIAKTKLVRIAQVSFVNAGTEPATEVQVTFNWRPQHFNIWPHRHYSTQTAPDDRFTVVLGSIPPNETVGFDLLAVGGDLPMITSAFSKECAASSVTLTPQEVHPRWKLLLVIYLIVAGIAGSLYLVALLVQFLAAN